MIKEYCDDMSIAVIRFENYGNNLKLFEDAFSEALLDFPLLVPADVTIVHYDGDYYAKTFGIEFSADNAPESYTRISHLEYTK